MHDFVVGRRGVVQLLEDRTDGIERHQELFLRARVHRAGSSEPLPLRDVLAVVDGELLDLHRIAPGAHDHVVLEAGHLEVDRVAVLRVADDLLVQGVDGGAVDGHGVDAVVGDDRQVEDGH